MPAPKEIWKQIALRYEVSNLGNVRSIDRFSIDKRRRKRVIKGKTLIHGIRKDGYHVVNITGFKHKRNWKVHQLVAFAFLDNPQNFKCINHKNGDKDNNTSNNLEWCTQKYNCLHAFRVLKRNPIVNTGSKNGFSKPVIDNFTGIYYDCIKEAAIAYNIKNRTLSAMLTGQNRNRTNLIYV